MVRDRLQELKVCYNSGSINNLNRNSVIIEVPSNRNNEDINATLEKHSQIKQLLNTVRSNTEEMRKISSDVLKSFSNPKHFSDEMNKKRQANISIYQTITGILRELENDLAESNDYVTVERMKYGLYHGNKEEVFQVWREYTNFLVAYEEKMKKMMKKQAYIAQHSLTEEESETLIGNNAMIFTGNILQETEAVRNNLKELVERYHELEKIEKSLQEVREMFIYMSTLVHQQGDVIQSIEFHAQRALSNVDQGGDELVKAKENKIKTLKKKTCILIWITGILVVLLLIAFLT